MPIVSLQNLASWSLQIALICLAGCGLPVVFRIRHPQSHLAYCYLLLAACFAVPFLQPLQHPVVVGESQGSVAPGGPSFVMALLAWILLAGFLAKMTFFMAGVVRLRHYRSTAVPIQFPKESILSICRLHQREVEVAVSVADIGPVTLGWRRPTILFPDSYLALEEEAQFAILCHELLHVARHDWLANMVEELIGAAFWFHPGVAFLLTQTKLAREQVVDAEVVRLTGAREPYVAALLAMAGYPEHEGLPAPQFFRGRHLARRLQLLLIDRPPSKSRLAASYASITLILGFVSGTTIAAFPLIGLPLSQSIARTGQEGHSAPLIASLTASGFHPALSSRRVWLDGVEQVVYSVGNGVSSPRVIASTDPEYPDAARLAGLEGTVVVEGIVMTDGSFDPLNTLDSPGSPELDHSALLALKRWKFEPGTYRGKPVPIRLVVELSFNLRPRPK